MDTNLSRRQEITEDREGWHATVHGVTKSRTQLSDRTTIFWCSDHLVFVAETPKQPSSPPCLFRAAPQSHLRRCILGLSPQFRSPNKTWFLKRLGCAIFLNQQQGLYSQGRNSTWINKASQWKDLNSELQPTPTPVHTSHIQNPCLSSAPCFTAQQSFTPCEPSGYAHALVFTDCTQTTSIRLTMYSLSMKISPWPVILHSW